MSAGASVLVIGAGGVGLNCIMAAALAGANPIIASDLVDSKLEVATAFGATHVLNPRHQDLVETVRDLTGGEGVDYAFEAIGNPRAISQAFAALRRGGVATAVGIAPAGSEVSVDAGQLVYQEKTLKGSYYGSSHFQADVHKLLRLYAAGRLPIDRLISRRYPLEQVNDAFAALLEGEVARSILVPT